MKSWYAYLHESGSLHVKMDMGDHDMGLLEVQESPYVFASTRVFFAANADAARRKALELLWDSWVQWINRQLEGIAEDAEEELSTFEDANNESLEAIRESIRRFQASSATNNGRVCKHLIALYGMVTFLAFLIILIIIYG